MHQNSLTALVPSNRLGDSPRLPAGLWRMDMKVGSGREVGEGRGRKKRE